MSGSPLGHLDHGCGLRRFDHVDRITLSYLFFESDSELPEEYEDSPGATGAGLDGFGERISGQAVRMWGA